jgi:hypothetical protein
MKHIERKENNQSHTSISNRKKLTLSAPSPFAGFLGRGREAGRTAWRGSRREDEASLPASSVACSCGTYSRPQPRPSPWGRGGPAGASTHLQVPPPPARRRPPLGFGGLGSESGTPDLGFHHPAWLETEGDENEHLWLSLTVGPCT